jgi:ATP-dependent DNA helicase DinG
VKLLKQSWEKVIFDIFEKKLTAHYGTSNIRLTQVQMAMDVAAFLHPRNRQKILFLEAPVGTGKSLGSLIPSLIEANQKGGYDRKQIVYATATINLQGQLMNEEVPLLKKIGLLKEAILAKGKSHYYCHKEYRAVNDRIDSKYQEAFEKFYGNSLTGHRDEFEEHYLQVVNPLWDRVSLKATKRECENCPYSGPCPSFLHRNKFLSDKNNLVITNHDQLIRSILNRLPESMQPPLVPIDPGIIIIDEAHHFQENFLGQLQKTINIKDLKSLTNNKLIPGKLKGVLKQTLNKLEDQCKQNAQLIDSQQGRYPVPDYFMTAAKTLIGLFNDVISHIESRNIGQSFWGGNRNEEFIDKVEEVTQILRSVLNDEDYVSWVVFDDLSVSCIANNFPTRFRELMLRLGHQNKIIVMSGTLTENGDFESLLNQWRLNNSLNVSTKSIPSSFDYSKQTLIYVPDDLHDPTKPDKLYITNQVEHIGKLLDLTQGRSLILATSKNHMKEISLEVKPVCDAMQITFLQQDQSGVEVLTKQFKNDETSILIGTGSFFSEFSVPGTALVSVIFTRLPFPVPDDPFLKLLGEGYEDEFFECILFPHMMVKLNQGIGRLIRDIKDYGIITILDPRVIVKKYSTRIQEDFRSKGYRITQSYDKAVRFYKGKLANGSGAEYEAYDRSKIIVEDCLKDFGAAESKIKSGGSGSTNKPQKDKVTEEQKKFAKMICEQNGVPYPQKIKNSQDLYEHLYNIYYSKYRRPTVVVDQFPYKDESQRKEFTEFQGSGGRTFKAPRCTFEPFGCDGTCSMDHQERISALVTQHGGRVDRFFKANGFCLLFIEPKEIIEDLCEEDSK